MKPPEFDYVAPTSIPDAVSALASDPDAKVLAGGQSLIPLLAFRLAAPSILVDLARIEGLDQIGEENGQVRIGAMTRQRRAESNPLLATQCPMVVEALKHVGHPQIRSRGTIGGSIAHGDPSAELPAVLVALDGKVRAIGPNGERIIDAADLYRGFLTTSLDEKEIVVDVQLRAARPRTGWSVVEIARRPGDYALCGVACQLETTIDGTVQNARLALFGVGDRPVRASGVEAALNDGATPREAAAMASDELHPPDDVHGSADYRRHLSRVVSERAILKALERST
ncbi:MAG: carbon-monoxide dehydrogenase medium subunit [Verrucomicrobiales bacterium]|jgi:carbon-monoxide dehydrogenase medium subunit